VSVHVKRLGAVAEIALDRPPVNAFDQAQVDALADAIAAVRADTGVSCVLVTGAGMFSAGADISMLASWQGQPGGAEHTVAFVARMQAAYAELAELPVPTVAAIVRAATGGGLELALACDLRVVARDARIGLPEVRIGLIPGAGGTQRMSAIAGPAVARRLILTGDLIDGDTAVALGLAHIAADPAAVEETARSLAQRIAALPRAALVAAKHCIAAADTPDGLREELNAVRQLSADPRTSALLTAFATRQHQEVNL
jgi:enoyl-CoA hydratase/carnithine racemase